MNKDQRKFLADKVEETFRGEIEELEKQIPPQPSLNNHIIAEILNGKIKFEDHAQLKKYLVDEVRKMGAKTELISESSEDQDDWSYRRNRRGSKREPRNIDDITLTVPAARVFKVPVLYKAEMEKYLNKRKEIEDKIDALTKQKEIIVMKVQIGSDAALQNLIMEVDTTNLTLNYINQKLIVTAGESKIALPAAKK